VNVLIKSCALTQKFFPKRKFDKGIAYHIRYFLADTPYNSDGEGLKGMERDQLRNKTEQPRVPCWPIEDDERASEADEGAKNKQINKIDVSEASRECR